MTLPSPEEVSVALDDATRALVRLAARIAGGSEDDVRDGVHEVLAARTPIGWVEELILQSYLFCGFPRALNAARVAQPLLHQRGGEQEAGMDGGRDSYAAFERRGEQTCARVYGDVYERLRQSVAALHPELDRWMIVEGYGKVLSRPHLDLGRRELCIVAACAATGQGRQLHSHLHGALNVGVPAHVVAAGVEGLAGVLHADLFDRARAVWAKVAGQNTERTNVH